MNLTMLPTGYLFTDEYSKGQLETLSIGDYGKHTNIKADFLGYNREICGVPNTDCMPLSEKWVITLSTQFGCRMKCQFCLHPDTLISTPTGKVKIKEVKVGMEVYGIGQDGVKAVQKVVNLFETPVSEDLFIIRLSDGKDLRITGNHEVMTLNGWKLAKDLTIEDEVLGE